MLTKTLLLFLTISCSSFLVIGQVSGTKAPDPKAKTSGGPRVQMLRDFSFSGGVDLQFLIRELASDMDLNVLFDPESRLENRKVRIELHEVTIPAALDYILLQEGLYFEESDPNTILVANQSRRITVPSIGIGVLPGMSKELAAYLGAGGGILVNFVRDDSPASKSGIKVGDVISEIDGVPISGTIGLIRAIDDKTQGPVTLTVVRDRRARTIQLTPHKGIEAIRANQLIM